MNESHEPVTVLHISDLHFGDEDQKKVSALRSLAAKTKFDVLCVTGDVAEYPRKAKFVAAKKFIDEIVLVGRGVPAFVVPGNHDAFLRQLSLGSFRKVVSRDTEFGEHRVINGKDVCIFGVDSTCFSLFDASNTGRFSRRSRANLEEMDRKLKKSLGDQKYKRALKICLIHHHPLPTLTSEQEGMLYMRNSAEFLLCATQIGFTLILHGHKHEPTYLSLNHNSATDEGSLVILSAGCATKKTATVDGLSRDTQVHLIQMFGQADVNLVVQCFQYRAASEDFWLSRLITKGGRPPTLVGRKLHYKYVANPRNGNMTAIERVYLRTGPGETLQEHTFQIGVDAETPECENDDRLNLRILQDDTPVDQANWQIARSTPRVKTISVTLPKPVDLYGTWLECRYDWPQGFKNLFANSKDSGTFPATKDTEELKVEFEISPTERRIDDFYVVFHDHENVTYLHGGETTRRGFIVRSLRASWVAQFRVTIS